MVDAMLAAPPEGGEVERSTIDSAATVWAVLTEALEGPLTVEERRKGERALSAFWDRLEAQQLTEEDLIAHLRQATVRTGIGERHLSPVESKEDLMAKGDIHTVPHGDGWANRVEGNKRVSNTAPKKAEAQERGRDMARERKVEHLVHRQDGTIGPRNTYTGRDPRRSKG